jgi:NAD(P)-binding Rossmann-like domain
MARLSKVAVVGGGIGGLTAALALLREGIDVDVYEQASKFQEVGAGVQISSNGTCVLHVVGLQEAIERVASVSRRRRRSGSGARARVGGCSTSARVPSSSMDFLPVHAPAAFTWDAGGGNPTPEARCLASRHMVRQRRPGKPMPPASGSRSGSRSATTGSSPTTPRRFQSEPWPASSRRPTVRRAAPNPRH